MIIENDGGNDYKIPHMGKESMERRGILPWVLDITPTANAWLNPMMDDNPVQDSDDLDDAVHVPMTTATPTDEMDGVGGENTTTDEIMNTGVKIILFRLNSHPAHVTMGRVGATAIRCTHRCFRCRWFCFCFDCCVSLLLPSIHDDVCEFLATFGKGERGGVSYIPLSSLKIVDSIYASQHCVALVLGATQTTTKISLVAKKFMH